MRVRTFLSLRGVKVRAVKFDLRSHGNRDWLACVQYV